MDKIQTTPNKKQHTAPKTGVVSQIWKLMLFLFLLHTLITLIAQGIGPLAEIRSFFLQVFWMPEGSPLPHQKLVHTVLTWLWNLPFWQTFWSLCGFPMLGLMIALSALRRVPGWIRTHTREYQVQFAGYQNAQEDRYLAIPSPGPRRRLVMWIRLHRLRKQNLSQAEELCRRTSQSCLVQILSTTPTTKPFHLVQDLATNPQWDIGRELEFLSPVFQDLIISRDQRGILGLFRRNTLLLALHPGTFWLWENENHQLSIRPVPPTCRSSTSIQLSA